MLLMVLFFFLAPNLLLRNFGLVVVASSLPTCSLIHGFCQQWTGSWVHLTGDFLVLVFFLSSSLSLSVVLVPQLVCSFMETLKMSETLISRDQSRRWRRRVSSTAIVRNWVCVWCSTGVVRWIRRVFFVLVHWHSTIAGVKACLHVLCIYPF